jgi:hypothetical protein
MHAEFTGTGGVGAGVPGIRHVLPTPDGQGYAYTYMRYLSELYVVDGLR